MFKWLEKFLVKRALPALKRNLEITIQTREGKLYVHLAIFEFTLLSRIINLTPERHKQAGEVNVKIKGGNDVSGE